jgi:hypothetical protein
MTEQKPRRRRPFVLAGIAALLAALLFYMRCGSGWGLGGGSGIGTGTGTTAPVRARCALKVTAAGIVVDGKPATRDEAVAACKSAGGAIVTVAGNAREGDWTELQRTLEAAHVPFDRRGP